MRISKFTTIFPRPIFKAMFSLNFIPKDWVHPSTAEGEDDTQGVANKYWETESSSNSWDSLWSWLDKAEVSANWFSPNQFVREKSEIMSQIIYKYSRTTQLTYQSVREKSEIMSQIIYMYSRTTQLTYQSVREKSGIMSQIIYMYSRTTQLTY